MVNTHIQLDRREGAEAASLPAGWLCSVFLSKNCVYLRVVGGHPIPIVGATSWQRYGIEGVRALGGERRGVNNLRGRGGGCEHPAGEGWGA